MFKKIFEIIEAWNGTNDTGAHARGKIERNFNKVNDALEEIEAAAATLQGNIDTLELESEQGDADLQEQIDELDALFLAVNQNIDGGVANSNYTSTPTLNGGGA